MASCVVDGISGSGEGVGWSEIREEGGCCSAY